MTAPETSAALVALSTAVASQWRRIPPAERMPIRLEQPELATLLDDLDEFVEDELAPADGGMS